MVHHSPLNYGEKKRGRRAAGNAAGDPRTNIKMRSKRAKEADGANRSSPTVTPIHYFYDKTGLIEANEGQRTATKCDEDASTKNGGKRRFTPGAYGRRPYVAKSHEGSVGAGNVSAKSFL